MKKSWLAILFFLFYPLTLTILLGDEPPPHPPIDGGSFYLLIAGVVYGIFQLRKRKP